MRIWVVVFVAVLTIAAGLPLLWVLQWLCYTYPSTGPALLIGIIAAWSMNLTDHFPQSKEEDVP